MTKPAAKQPVLHRERAGRSPSSPKPHTFAFAQWLLRRDKGGGASCEVLGLAEQASRRSGKRRPGQLWRLLPCLR